MRGQGSLLPQLQSLCEGAFVTGLPVSLGT